MEILRKKTVLFILVFFSFFAKSQSFTISQAAFSESYKLEYEKKYSDAIVALQKCYKEDNYEINLRLGWLSYNAKNYTNAEMYYDKASQLKPYSIEAKLGLAKVLSAASKINKLTSIYQSILKIDVQNYTSNYWLGVIYYNQKRYELAIKYFEKIVNLYPFDFDANHMMGWTCYFLGRNNDAKMLFQKALLNQPNNASCLEGLSLIK